MREAERAKIRAAIDRAFRKQRRSEAKADIVSAEPVNQVREARPPFYETGLFAICFTAFLSLGIYVVSWFVPILGIQLAVVVLASCFGVGTVFAVIRDRLTPVKRRCVVALSGVLIWTGFVLPVLIHGKVLGFGIDVLTIPDPSLPQIPQDALVRPAPTPPNIQPSFVVTYSDHKIEIDNMSGREMSLWGVRLSEAPVEMDVPRILPIQPFAYHIDGNKLEPLLRDALSRATEVRWAYYLFIKDSEKYRYTLRTMIRAVMNKDDTLHIDMQNLGVVSGWKLSEHSQIK
jgi:hypothetical protein